MHITRRQFLGTAVPGVLAANAFAAERRRFRLLLRSSWQTVNIGDIAHTPGMLALLEKYRPDAEVYAQAAALVSFEQHSPIMGIAAGVPSVLLRQPTDTRKGRIWYDLGLSDWVFEIDDTTGAQIAERLVQVGKNLPAARAMAGQSPRSSADEMQQMIAALPR